MDVRRFYRSVWLCLAMGVALARFAPAPLLAAPAADASLPQLVGRRLTDLDGQEIALSGDKAAKLTVLVFLGTECPVSNGYLPALEKLRASYASQSVKLLGVHCDSDVSAEIARRHAQEYKIHFPLALDHQQHLASACGAQIMPTAVVIRADGQVVYRGRIDNRYALSGARRPEATVFDLRDAIDAALAGRTPEVTSNRPFGCPLPTLKAPTGGPAISTQVSP